MSAHPKCKCGHTSSAHAGFLGACMSGWPFKATADACKCEKFRAVTHRKGYGQ